MRIAPGLSIDDLPGGGVRVRARDWPFALWLAVPALFVGVPLAVWSAATANWIELGGALVFCAFGSVCAGLALAKRRDVEVRAASVRGCAGAGPFAAPVKLEWKGEARLEIRPFAVPAGAPELPDRGGDLVVVVPGGAEFPLARRVGPDWASQLEAARDHVARGMFEAG